VTKQNIQRHEASRGLFATAELLVIHWNTGVWYPTSVRLHVVPH